MTVTVESAASAALGCSLPGCPAAPLVQWQRRPTEAELAALVEVEQSKRDAVLAAADAEEPGPVFGPLPTAADTTIAVYACGPHAISMDLAALIHACGCTAPNLTNLPSCDCTPEPPPPADEPISQPQPLPDHWT